jgi:nicotinate phosphoribosyltransferase
LRLFQLNRSYLHCSLNDDGTLNLYAEGPIWAISPFEIYCLSIVNEVYFFHKYRDTYLDLCKTLSERTDAKIRKWMCAGGSILMDPFTLNEFGTRRRFMRDAQGIIIDRLAVAGEKYFFGTSNPMWAMKKGLRPIGTFAHEFVCYCQALNDCTLSNSQRYAWNVWQREYHAALGICLTDTLGQEKFEKDFDPYWANLFTGCRHDSGDPIEWGDRLLDIYRSFNIDPRSKTLMFSDSLDFDKAQKIQDHFYDKCKISFGIGTYLTNDTGVEPLNIVMKLQEANGKPVAKLSNVSGKTMCGDDKYVEYLKWAISQ